MSDNDRMPGGEFDQDVIEPVRPFSKGDEPASGTSERPRWLIPFLGGALIFGLIVVVGVLPRLVSDSSETIAPTVTEQPVPTTEEPEPSEVIDPATQARLKQQAEQLLTEAVNQEAALEEQGAPNWGGDDWIAYEESMKTADLAFIAKDFAAATAEYETVLEMGQSLLANRESRLSSLLDAGREALVAGNVEGARSAFQQATGIDPENSMALAGIDQAAVLEQVLKAMQTGEDFLAESNLKAASEAFQEAVRLDGNWKPARDALNDVNRRIVGVNFASAMSSGLTALNQDNFKDAESAFRRALAIRPGAAEAEAGLTQAIEGRRLDQITVARTRGKVFEDLERWNDAIGQYESALAIDSSLAFAKEGLERARVRASLDAKLGALLESPSRLFDARVLNDTQSLIAEGRATEPMGARLSEQLDRLQALVRQASTPIRVQLRSDGLTSVTVFRVGQLGLFESREIELRPGNYTAVGSRDGFRDVRASFKVRPGSIPPPVEVRCVEPI